MFSSGTCFNSVDNQLPIRSSDNSKQEKNIWLFAPSRQDVLTSYNSLKMNTTKKLVQVAREKNNHAVNSKVQVVKFILVVDISV